MFLPLSLEVFTDILKIYELPKIYNKTPKYWQALSVTKIIYEVPTSSGFWAIPQLTLLKMSPKGQRIILGLNLKKYPCYDIFLKRSTKRVLFLLHQMLSLFATINFVYVLEINIFGEDYSNLNNPFQRY